MGRHARRQPGVAVAVGALVTVVATGLLGLGYAQAAPPLVGPDLPAESPVAAPASPVEHTRTAAPSRGADRTAARDRGADLDDVDDADRTAAPARLNAAAPPAPAPAPSPEQAPPPAEPAPAPAPPPPPPLVHGTPCTATARACVALDERQAWLIDNGRIVRGPVLIQHGDAADPTPRGTFTVQWKAEEYTSREYLRQMPYSVFFADGGIAFHEGAQDTPSAGCVKLDRENAQAFFYFLQVGDEVQIH